MTNTTELTLRIPALPGEVLDEIERLTERIDAIRRELKPDLEALAHTVAIVESHKVAHAGGLATQKADDDFDEGCGYRTLSDDLVALVAELLTVFDGTAELQLD